MKLSTVFGTVAATLLVCVTSSALAQQHCPNPSGQWTQIDRTRHPFDQDGIPQDKLSPHTRAQISDDKIYGHEIMSARELKQYRKALRKVGADDEKLEEFLAQHRERMHQRAQEQGVELEDVKS
jgi:hypothetical protein